MINIEYSVAAPLYHLNFVVQSLDKTACPPVGKTVRYLFGPFFIRLQKLVIVAQTVQPDPYFPDVNSPFCLTFGNVLLKNVRQFLTEPVSRFQFRRVSGQTFQNLRVFRPQFLRQALFCRANFQFATCNLQNCTTSCRANFQFATCNLQNCTTFLPYFAGQISNLPHAKLHHILPYFVGQSFNLPVQFAKLHYRAGLILQGKFSICPMLPLHPPYICFRMKNSSSNPMHPSLFTSATRLISAASAKPASIFRHP